MKKYIIKQSGKEVYFDAQKLINSLKRTGASNKLAKEIATEVEKCISDKDTTSVVYKKAFEILNQKKQHVFSMKYSVRRALLGFGPSGFPFEKFVAELFKYKGYDATTNVILQGRCISHEVDVFISKPKKIAMEVKFHNDKNLRTDIKVILYIQSRFNDLMHSNSIFKFLPGICKVEDCVLITNTKYTSTAIKYAECENLKIIGWDYPKHKNLMTLIEEVNAHPITCLRSLKQPEAKELFDMGITTCRQFIERVDKDIKLKNKVNLKKEAILLCHKENRK